MNPVALRLLNQQLICPQFSSPTQVVAHLGAMQAQDYRMMRWAVAMRTKRPSQKAFLEAYNSGEIIRMHLLRGTWQLIAAHDYNWMLELCGPKSLSIITGWMKSNRISIDDDELLSVRQIILSTIGDRTDITKDDIATSLSQHGLNMDDHRISYHIRLAELSGHLVSGDLHPSKATYCLTSNKIKPSSSATPISHDEALARLTTKYFQSRCPATLQDFIWWSGLNSADCTRGIQLLGDKLHTVSYGELTFYLLDGCRTRGFRKGCTHLIPPFDEYLIGYKSRDVVLPPQYRHLAHSNNGIFYPIIARNGIICGNWSPYKNNLLTRMFNPDTTTLDLQSPWLTYQKYKIQK